MKKTLSYRLFRLGSVPKTLLPVLEGEGVIVLDEGMGGAFIAKHVNGPGRRYRQRAAGFSGSLVVTRQRLVCCMYSKRQIDLPVNDPRIHDIHVNLPREERLSISFESSGLWEGWEGVIEYRFHTEKAVQFYNALIAVGARQGAAVGDG